MNEINDEKISRRKFLGLSSSAIAMMSLAGLGFSKGYAKNEPTIAVQDILNKGKKKSNEDKVAGIIEYLEELASRLNQE